MRSVLILLMTAILLGSLPRPIEASPARDQEKHDLNKRHKDQRKALKVEQRGMKKVMKQHELSGAERQRFTHQLKMERQVLRSGQKDETKTLKERRKFTKRVKQTHAS
jgi:hypothetical protein